MKTAHIKFRNMPTQVVLAFVTLGIYVLYWYYVTLKELHIASGNDQGVAMWTLMGVIPIAAYFSNWHYSPERTERCSYWRSGLHTPRGPLDGRQHLTYCVSPTVNVLKAVSGS